MKIINDNDNEMIIMKMIMKIMKILMKIIY